MTSFTRRTFLATGLTSLAALLAAPALSHARAPHHPRRDPHPEPRPGITGAKVATKEQLADKPELIPLFDSVRAMPEIADGIRCHCGCADTPGFRSLLSCYEGDAMARDCHTCQGQGRLAARLHASGKSLNDIRSAIDARFA